VSSLRWGARHATFTPAAGAASRTLEIVLADPPPEPDAPAGAEPLGWAPGVYTATVVIRVQDRPDVVSNALPFALGPTVTVAAPGAAAGEVEITIECTPPPDPGQTVLLLLTGRPPLAPEQVAPPAGAGQPARITFTTTLAAGDYLAVLRVDGVDSMPYRVRTEPDGTAALEYDPADRVTVA
jgi:hypothetical protein